MFIDNIVYESYVIICSVLYDSHKGKSENVLWKQGSNLYVIFLLEE